MNNSIPIAFDSPSPDLSFVIPCYKSENYIVDVIDEISRAVSLRHSPPTYEIIAVVDGSPDNVFSVLKEASRDRPFLRVVNLSMNFGQTSARMAGYHLAKGEIIVTLDDDGQCPIDCVWDLIRPVENGTDAAIAEFPTKKQSAMKNFGSALNSVVGHALIGIPRNINLSSFVAFNQFVRKELIKFTAPHPHFSGLLFQITKNVVNVPMEQRARIEGGTTYSFRKLVSVWINGFVGFSIKPLRIADFVGVSCAIIGFALGIAVIVARLTSSNILAGYSSTIAAILFIGGILMLLLGMIGEYVGRILILLNHVPQFVIREVVDYPYDNTEKELSDCQES